MALAFAWGASASAQAPEARVVSLKPAPAPALAFEDQFERPHKLTGFQGDILVLIYGDRESAEQNKLIGESLHLFLGLSAAPCHVPRRPDAWLEVGVHQRALQHLQVEARHGRR